jgi:toxin ParE1/3/4
MKIHIDDGALVEMEAAVEYSAYFFGVGDKLTQAIIHASNLIAADPFRFRKLTDKMRIYHLPHFPYYFIFSASTGSETVSIYVFGHTSRRPGYWKSRFQPLP